VARLEDELRVLQESRPSAITDADRAEISALGAELPRLWNHPAASAATRKRILRTVLRTVLEEIVVTTKPGRLLLNCIGRAEITPRSRGENQHRTTSLEDMCRDRVADLRPGARRTGSEHRMHSPARGAHVERKYRGRNSVSAPSATTIGIAVYRDGEGAERGEVTLAEAEAASPSAG